MAGRTWLVTHFRKSLALGLRLVKIRLYRPDSLTVSNSRGPAVVPTVAEPLSSSSSRLTAMLGSAMPRISHTSLATNQAWPSFAIVRTRAVSNSNSTGRFLGSWAAAAISSKDMFVPFQLVGARDRSSARGALVSFVRQSGRGGIAGAGSERQRQPREQERERRRPCEKKRRPGLTRTGARARKEKKAQGC